MKPTLCPHCQALLTPDYVGVPFHFETDCLHQQLRNAQAEISKLKVVVGQWKEAWYRQWDATGKNYWDGYIDGKKVSQ